MAGKRPGGMRFPHRGPQMKVVETFRISGRGLVVMIDTTTELPVGKKLSATITRPDGSTVLADAFKEWLRRSSQEPIDQEAFLLLGLSESDVPLGSDVRLAMSPAP